MVVEIHQKVVTLCVRIAPAKQSYFIGFSGRPVHEHEPSWIITLLRSHHLPQASKFIQQIYVVRSFHQHRPWHRGVPVDFPIQLNSFEELKRLEQRTKLAHRLNMFALLAPAKEIDANYFKGLRKSPTEQITLFRSHRFLSPSKRI